ncbi:Alpha/Beta hydrolase protein [Lophiotrema nucula]|uniref:Alpha/Beta hydrolase protein n=1 Tax=Lophiotrema nucula TaxID=690887 RepID=A0A6A5YSQ0_9PLEO|nr:Alpha/Beta hydrolase protein [Lophiotrema nucula]
MPHPPEPHYSFTVPSIHDDTTLDCRLYHPEVLSQPSSRDVARKEQWRRRGIVMAHPYAPLGGSFEDRVVGIVVTELLALGYVVGTFNFRGAHGSKGRTSWSGKPELDDYLSVAAFFMHYMSYVQPFPTPDTTFTPESSPVKTRAPKPGVLAKNDPALIILGGYSYGSMILRHLPPVPSILHPFSAPMTGSAASEILLRARKLADQSNLEWINLARDHEHQRRRGHVNKLSVTMGGEETNPDLRRSSREIRRSIDGGRRSLDLKTRMRSVSHRRRKKSAPGTPPESNIAHVAITMPHVRYLLISPLTPPVSTLAAPGLSRFWSRWKEEHHEVVGKHTALAVYGDQDIFSSVKKVREWATKLSSEPGSRFSHAEVAGAGHFWIEHGVEEKLRSAIRDWEAGIR